MRRLTVERLLKATDVSDLLIHVIPGDRWVATLTALHHAEAYVQGAALQQNRIARIDRRLHLDTTRAESQNGATTRRRRSLSRDIPAMAREIHFYLICWNTVGRNLRLIQELTQFRAVRQALRPHYGLFKQYTDMRDHLEHFDDRLRRRDSAGGRRRGGAKVMKQPNDFGNSSRNVYSFGGDRLDISQKSLLTLRRVVEQVVLALKYEAWSTVADSQPQVAERLVSNVVRNRQIWQLLWRNGPGVRAVGRSRATLV